MGGSVNPLKMGGRLGSSEALVVGVAVVGVVEAAPVEPRELLTAAVELRSIARGWSVAKRLLQGVLMSRSEFELEEMLLNPALVMEEMADSRVIWSL